jgi:hypothetical protein
LQLLLLHDWTIEQSFLNSPFTGQLFSAFLSAVLNHVLGMFFYVLAQHNRRRNRARATMLSESLFARCRYYLVILFAASRLKSWTKEGHESLLM